MRLALAAAVTMGVAVTTCSAEVYLEECFDTFDEERWVQSTLWKPDKMAPFKHSAGKWNVDPEANKGIMTTGILKHHAISTKLAKPFSNKDKDLVIQFSVKNEGKADHYDFCGGGYIKLHPSGINQTKYGGDDTYNIMFGPDLCSYDVSKIHLIFRDKSGKNLERKDQIKLEYADKDEYTHLYTLILKADGSYKVLFDSKEKASGKLPDGWDFPPKEIDDPTDKKPSDWVDEKQIPDPSDTKPADWDQPERIPDPDATKPADWDDEMDGEWDPATVANPAYKGEWKQKMIDNPAYKGEWKAKQIPNPDYTGDVWVYDDNAYVGFELWTVHNNSIFDNVLITDDEAYATAQAEKLFKPTKEGEKKAKEAYEEAKKKKDEKKDENKDEKEEDKKDATKKEQKTEQSSKSDEKTTKDEL